MDFDQIEILAQLTGCAKVILLKPGHLGEWAASNDTNRPEAVRRLVEIGLKAKK
jgi:hypothetical protein